MSRQADEQRFRGKAKPNGPHKYSTFVSFTPKAGEITTIISIADNPSGGFSQVERMLSNGCGISTVASEDGGGVKLLLYDRSLPFDDRTFYSFYASTLLRAFAQIEFAISQDILEWSDGIVYKRQLDFGL